MGWWGSLKDFLALVGLVSLFLEADMFLDRHPILLGCLCCGLSAWNAVADSPANRLTYLDESDPFYVGLNFPKLTTPQWVGEAGVEAVVILAIDDMRETPKYETMLRPILDRLKQIDGRAPVSIMVNAIAPTNAQLQAWLKEGVSLDVHTIAHPCPLLARSNFTAAAETYHNCVDLMNQIPGNQPVAFRMPCCDSMDSPSPRFYAEIFNRVSPGGHFLTIDSSVMNMPTAKDKSLPREWVLDADGREKFRKYLPSETNATTRVSMQSFVTTIEDYPYPYVIGKLCWEFPCMVPSDWEANNLHKPNNAATVADWKAALDATVLKQGVFTFIFHPHGWIKAEQMVELIDYAVRKHGKKVKFLNFREAQERLDNNLLLGQPLRAANGQDNGVRLLDLNQDGFQDVVIGNMPLRKARIWEPSRNVWRETDFPAELAGVQFGIIHAEGPVIALKQARTARLSQPEAQSWRFDANKWIEDKALLNGLELEGQQIVTMQDDRDRGVRFRDVDNDGRCELIVGNELQNAVFAWSDEEKAWKKLPFALPNGTAFVDAEGRDAGLRFVDVNQDGYDDVLFSNEKVFSLHQFVSKANPRLSWQVGWTDQIVAGKRGDPNEIPMIARNGSNNGAWFHSRHMWVQNEDTAQLPDKVDRRSFKQLLTADQSPAKSPAESLASIKVRSGFKVELVAAEPLVMDPIAFEWGPDGKLWVVEMADYPLGIPVEPLTRPAATLSPSNGERDRVRGDPARTVSYKPGGRVRFLEDTDGDGRYDKSTVFLDGVPFPTGIIPWRKGVIISSAPEIFYAEDTDGDGKADVKTSLFTGFVEGNQQHRLNGFDYGLDNWLYGANGDSGGLVRRVGAATAGVPDSPVNLRGHDFRLRPDEGLFESIEGQTQYGRHRDDWGNWFGNNNATWVWHYFLPEHYLARNPQLAVKTTKQVLGNYPESGRCYPLSRTQQRFNDPWTANHVTSGCSATPYRDELFGPDFVTSVFVTEPVHNLIHREVLEPDGVTFRSRRAADEQGSEFLASSDNWFRPTMLKTGPDGALYIADMYRQVIEHPEWITKDQQARLDLRAGDDQGRIYRVYPEGTTLRRIPRLDPRDLAGLVAALDSPNGWQRDTAQRLLVHARDKTAVEPLKKLMTQSANPKARLHALGTLDGLAALTPELLVAALKDSHPAVREHAIRVSESFVHSLPGEASRPAGGAAGTALENALLKLMGDPDVRVRRQLAFTLGEWNDPRAGRALAELALRDADNSHLQTAVLSSAVPHVGEMLTTIFAESHDPPPAKILEQLLGLAVAQKNEGAFLKVLEEIARPAADRFVTWQTPALAGFLDAIEREYSSLNRFQASASTPLKKTLAKVDAVFAEARLAALSSEAPEAVRQAAIRLLGRGLTEQEGDIARLGELLLPQVPSPLQQAALAQLRRATADRVAEVALARWKTCGPALRTEVINLLFSRPGWVQKLLAAIESGNITPGEIGATHQQKLTTHNDTLIRERAAKLFSATRADRQAVLKEYAAAAKLNGDRAKGGVLFRQNCIPCHRLKGEGTELGADLGMMAGKPVSTLLVAILDPNQAVEARYINYTVVTKGGRELSGIIASETGNSLSLRSVGGSEEIVLRGEVKELTSSGLSIMPEGFEKGLSPQDLADLIAYILNP